MASAPYRLEPGPRMISMRSTWARLMAARSVWPSVAEPMRTPSISTSVLLELLPRIIKPALWPGPPLRDICMPPSRRSRSSIESALLARMRSRSMTTTSATTRSSAVGARVPMTCTVEPGLASAWAQHEETTGNRAQPNSSRAGRSLKIEDT